MAKIATFTLIALIPLPGTAQQTTGLRDGAQFTGMMVSATDTSVIFCDGNGDRRRFDVGEIQPIRFNGKGPLKESNSSAHRSRNPDVGSVDDRSGIGRYGRETPFNGASAHMTIPAVEGGRPQRAPRAANLLTGDYGASIAAVPVISGAKQSTASGSIPGTVSGSGIQALTRGNEVRVPAETRLSFRLDRPLVLNAIH
jgi:hypothetical protein